RENVKTISAQLPLTSLAEDIDALNRTLERTSGPVVLVGHAYAGAVISAMKKDRVKALVYIAALAPDESETVANVFYRSPPHPDAPRLTPDAHGFLWMPEEGFRQAVAHNASTEEIAVLATAQRPIALGGMKRPVPLRDGKSKASVFRLAEGDRRITRGPQLFRGDGMRARVRSCKTDHSPMLPAPNLVVDTTREAVREPRSP